MIMFLLLLFDYCNVPWWLLWLLPFLLGLLLGWFLWAQKIPEEPKLGMLDDEILLIKSSYEQRLAECENGKAQLQSEISSLKNNITASASSIPIPRDLEENKTISISNLASVKKITDFMGDDNFLIIEGIGTVMDNLLKENGITDFTSLASTSETELRNMLDKYGNKYRIINPKTWPLQADLARKKKWDELMTFQKEIMVDKQDDDVFHQNDSKLEKILFKNGVLKKWAQNDLKAIEGIGPKIEVLLHDAGIKTWSDLASSSVSDLEKILREAGPQYQLASPNTWPQQAELADGGKWKELEELQDHLIGGRDLG
jgi:predicted flap endonuclease-1-like 5' DNA nuclease